MDVLRSVKGFFINSFKYPKPYNWGYPVFFGSCGLALAYLVLRLLFATDIFPFSSTSLIGCAVVVLVIEMLAFVLPSVLIAEKGGLYITGRYTGIGVMILSFLSGAALYLIKASFHNLLVAGWLRIGGTIVFPMVFYHLDEINGQTLFLSLLIDTIIPAFGLSLFFLGAVWQGFSGNNKRWAYVIIPLLIALFSFDLLDIAGIIVIGWWLCILRNNTENIYCPILALISSRLTGILVEDMISEIDITSVRVFSDIPSTVYYSSVPALLVAIIMLAFFRKALAEFHYSYSNDVYGEADFPDEKDGGKAGKFYRGINLTLILGIAVCIVIWALLFDGARI